MGGQGNHGSTVTDSKILEKEGPRHNSGYQVVSKLDFSSKIAYDFLICPEKHKRRSIRKERP